MSRLEWHLQLERREWVLWGYKGQQNPMFISPAQVIIDFGIPNMDPYVEDFSLPKNNKGLPDYREFDRVVAWGWRFRTNDLYGETWWQIAKTKEKALNDAQAYAEEDYNRHKAARDRSGFHFEQALRDIRVVEVP